MFGLLRHFLPACILALSLCVASAPVMAEMSKGEAAAKAKRSHGGKVLNVSKVGGKNGKSVYKVKLLLKGGRVKTVVVSG